MKAAWTACALGLVAHAAVAGVIRLETVVLSHADSDSVSLNVLVRHAGDTPARQVAVEGRLGGQSRSVPLPDLLPGATAAAELDFTTPSLPEGMHAAEIRLRYRDRNGYPFSTVSIRNVAVGAPVAPLPVDIRVEPAALGEEGRLGVVLRLRETSPPMAVRLRLLLPDDLAGEAPDRTIGLVPGREVRVEAGLANRTARPGSAYAVYAVVSSLEAPVREAAACGSIRIESSAWPPFSWPIAGFGGAALLALLFLVVQVRGRAEGGPAPAGAWFRARAGSLWPLAVLALIAAFLAAHIPVRLLVLDTTIAGGDTPAHLYLASHLQSTLFGGGGVVSWAGGWWGGFPAFRYYFPLPYLLAAVLGKLLPFKVAFKLVTVLGLFLLPPCAWGAGRLMRFPRPVPLLLAVAMVPFLFVRTHSMWGVNLSSTLAGMIANSLSFPLMVLTLASAWRDAEDGRFRSRTALGWALTILSHFFTSVMGAATAAAIPLVLLGRRPVLKTAGLLAAEGLLAALMTAWWWMPLLARRAFSMDFGTDWPVSFPDTLPPYAPWLTPLVAAGLAVAVRRGLRPLWLLPWMGGVALALFGWGSRVSPVFVNIRLWPFFWFAFLAMAACGAGLLLAGLRRPWLPAAAVALAALGLTELGERNERWAVRPGVEAAPPARPCAEWNFEGLERKPMWPALRKLLDALKGTPGRLAYELNGDNTVLGSVRVFEAVPHLAGKPVLEGGLVNSAVGSMFAYYLQSESSLDAAGFPEIVKPSSFNPAQADAHFRLFTVSHFIARSPRVKDGFAALPGWKRVLEAGDWTLFEAPGDRRYVRIPRCQPAGVLTARWKEWAMEWLYTPAALEQPFVFLAPGSPEAARFPGPVLSEEQFRLWLEAKRRGGPEPAGLPAGIGQPTTGGTIRRERLEDGRLSFETDAPGQPHLVASIYDPDWRSPNGAVYQATPGFLLLYPDATRVELAYGRSGWVWAGLGLAWAGWLAWLALAWRGRPRFPAGAWRAEGLKMLDATLGPLACRLAGLWREPRPGPSGGDGRLLVIRPGGMGDMILLLPVLRRLIAAFPGTPVDVVCEKRNRPVLELAGLPVTVLEADIRPWQTWWRLRRGGYRAVVDSEQFHHLSALLARVTGAPVRIGFKINPLRNPLYTHLAPYDMDGHEGRQFMRLLEPLGAAGPFHLEGCLAPAWKNVRPAVRDEAARLADGRRLVVLHAGGTRLEKRWGGDRFGRLAASLLLDPGVAVGLVGGAGDIAESRDAVAAASGAGDRLRDWTGRLSLEETAWVLARGSVFAGCDSGVAHLAAALGIPTVVLFGPGDPRKWGLSGARHAIIRTDLSCAPCAVFGYQKACRGRRCLREIGVERVAEAVRSLLKA